MTAELIEALPRQIFVGLSPTAGIPTPFRRPVSTAGPVPGQTRHDDALPTEGARPGTGSAPRSTATADEADLRTLHREHGRALFNYLLWLTCGDRQQAEDFVQETLLRAWRHPEVFASGRASIRPWLYTVARRIAIDEWRSRRSRPAMVTDAALASTPTEDDDISVALIRHDVTNAMNTLSAEHRAVIMEVYFRGRSAPEAAEVLDIPVGTVKSRTYYALRQLRLAMEEQSLENH